MFSIYRNRIKVLFRQKSLLFWSMLFPILLGTFFGKCIGDAYTGDNHDTVDIAIINEQKDETQYKNFVQVFENLKFSEETDMFDITQDKTYDEAVKLMNDGKLSAVVVFGDQIKMYVHTSGISQSITKSVIDSYIKVQKTVNNVLQVNGGDISSIDIESLSKSGDFVKNSDEMNGDVDPVLGYFHALIAMTCLFAASLGHKEMTDMQANQSTKGARVCISPVKRYKLIIGSFSAAFTFQVIADVILMLYLVYALNVDFGSRIGYVVLTLIVASLNGLFLGSMISAFVKGAEDTKMSMISAVTLTSCFFAGLMFNVMKYVVATYIPFFQYINPATLITNALYSLYYYNTLDKFYLNIGLLSIFTVVMAVVTCIKARRAQYASL